tara:strand:- start:533 stop:1174 length:642 start_codon:yes stop_codon:yes gene_type:complete
MALTKFNYNSFDVTPVASNAFSFNSTPNGLSTVAGGALNLITTNTISSGVSSSSFTSSINSTYDTYLFKFINIHPAENNTELQVNFRDGGSDFDATKTTSVIDAHHAENDSSSGLDYGSSDDIAQGTGYQTIGKNISNDNDGCCSGEMYLFSPSSTSFVKHFISRSNKMETSVTADFLVAGYCNVTAAIDGVDFKMSSGNIDSGVIKMYGITK